MPNREKVAARYDKMVKFVSSNIKNIGLDSYCGLNLLQDPIFDQVKVNGMSLLEILNKHLDLDVSDILDQYLAKFKDKYNDSPKILNFIPKLRKVFKPYQNLSLTTEFDRLREHYSFLGRKEDVRPLITKMMIIAKKLKSREYEERVMRLPKWHSSIAQKYINKRRKTCSKILTDNHSIQQDYNQGQSSSCYALAASNFLNYHSGFGDVSAYIFTYSVFAITTHYGPI